MKAVILAAGKGTRMRELTNELPKPMLKVQGKPILQHIIEGLSQNGISQIFIVTGYRAETIEGHAFHEARRDDAIGIDVVAGDVNRATGDGGDFFESHDFKTLGC